MTLEFIISGMTCSACQANITKAVLKLEGVTKVNVNLLSANMIVEFDSNKVSANQIIEAVKGAGYGAELKNAKNEKSSVAESWNKSKSLKKQELKEMKTRLISSIVLLILLLYVSMGEMIGLPQFWFFVGEKNSVIFALYQLVLTTIILIINKKFFIRGFGALIKRSPNMDTLVSVGSASAYIYSLVITFLMAYNLGAGNMQRVHEFMHSLYFESSATIVTLVLLGKFFESLSKQRTTSALDKLINLAPKTATILRDGKELVVASDSIARGDIVIIRPGDTVPADGVIIEGEGYLNQSAITGESMPIKKAVGEEVISASLCENGSFKFRANKVGEDTTLYEIIKLVETAGNSKAPISRIADKVSGVFVPIVMAISLITFVVWICVSGNLAVSLKNMIAVLVISCPCALGLATPVAIMVGMGKSASFGVLIKSAETLEILHKANVVVFDKTGTITTGSPTVSHVELLEGKSKEEFLLDLAVVESGSNHPLAVAIKKCAPDYDVKDYKIKDYNYESGGGITTTVNGENFVCGNIEFVKKKLKIKTLPSEFEKKLCEFQAQGNTTVVLAKEKKIQGAVCISDEIRAESKDVIDQLNKKGIKTVMLSGDSKLVAENVAKTVNIQSVYAEVLPANKQQIISELQSQGNIVIMVGDGINDSPALTSADASFAISSGSDIAVDSADVVLTGNSLCGIISALGLSKATITNIKINLFWAFIYNMIGIPLAAGVFYPIFGWTLNPMISALAMSLSSVCVVLNALSLNFYKNKKSAKNNTKLLKNSKVKEDFMKKIVYIDGMMCAHCVKHVTEALSKIKGITKCDVSLEEKKAEVLVLKSVKDDEIKKAIEDAGYTVVSIECE